MPAEVTRIQDYAIIGNGRSAALISKRGSLGWLCWPRFDSPSIFGAILDPKSGGHWRIRPANDSKVSRRYIESTNVLETTFLEASGQIVLTDFMPVASEESKGRALWPEHELVRQIKCQQGEVEVVMQFSPRLDYGRVAPKIKDTGKFGWRIDTGTNLFILRGDIDLEPTPD
ncbi:MAG TPA: trehalase-like domain-containing protein, partial [Candidatus Udaeobacter sp.]|nr:trehalase-like domain-containing protein [Candidatus Udaeobacter sp.]